MDSKQILTLNKRQSIVQRIDAMKASFSANKIKDKLSRYHYFGYPSQLLVDKLISKIPSNTVTKNSTIAVINDFGLEVISQLQLLGYTNLILLCTESDDKLYNIIKYMVEKEFNFTNIERLQDMNTMSDKFDLVIANPPYEIGNAVITETMKHCEEAVVLMPVSKYKGKDLYKYVLDLEVVDPKLFADAQIGDSLVISFVNNFSKDISWDKFVSNTYDINYRLIYEFNFNTKETYLNLGFHKKDQEILVDKDFMITMRTVQNGTHSTTDCADYPFNVLNTFNHENMPKDKPRDKYSCMFLRFNSAKEKSNFAHFWYNGKLMNALIKGLNKPSGTPYAAIPNIDWSRTDVEYTDEHVLSQMGLKWNENKDGVERI